MATVSAPLPATPRDSAISSRLLSLDVLRGITMAAMVLVNDPGSGAVYTQLDHAEWHGATFTDMIFPCFLVITGMAMTLSFASRLNRGASHTRLALHAVRRGLLIVGIGLLLNLVFNWNFAHLRFPGVLQRIGVCYIAAALLYLAVPGPDRSRSRRQRELVLGSAAVFLLVLYWALLKLYPTPGFGPGRLDPVGSLPSVVDRAVFGLNHMWRGGWTPGFGVSYDPEGLLSTLPAIANVLFGILAGEILRSEESLQRRCGQLATMGTVLWLLGLGASYWLPLNKKLWTSSFALFTSGLSILAMAGLLYLVDIRRVRRGWDLFLVFGTNAILAYVLSDLVAYAFGRFRFPGPGGRPVNVHGLLMRFVLATHLPPKMASLGYAVVFLAAVGALILPLYRKRLFLRL